MTLDALRRFAISRSLFAPTSLKRALDKLGFVQADPIRAPARAQDLTLRHRVKDYRAGDLERRYSTLAVEEDCFINYGFLPTSVQALMHPRAIAAEWPAARNKRAQDLLAFVHERREVHPREVDRHFAHGTVTNYWGGSSNATTHLLDAMHYGGMLRVARRERGIRIYAARAQSPRPAPAVRDARIDALIDVAVRKYAPLPAASLSALVNRLRYGVPQWRGELRAALHRAKERLSHARVDGIEWYWPADERIPRAAAHDSVRLLGPFDPIVWDRRRFELLWGWAYRFEAYTPAPRRKLGYYALPLLWRDRVIGWSTLVLKDGRLETSFGYIDRRPAGDRAFRRELEVELHRVRWFLGLPER